MAAATEPVSLDGTAEVEQGPLFTGPKAVNAGEVWKMLRQRYPKPGWALLREVRNDAGHNANRSADAIAMSLWPSHGLTLQGFEIKTSRSDWLRELKQPEKADAMLAVCDFWWLVCSGRDIARPDEIPASWGCLVPRGTSLAVAKQAPRLNPLALDRGTLASLLRRAQEASAMEEELAAARQAGYEDGKKLSARDLKFAQGDLERLKATIQEFESASGIDLRAWSYRAERLGVAVKAIMQGGTLEYAQRLAECANDLEAIIKGAREAATKLASIEREPK